MPTVYLRVSDLAVFEAKATDALSIEVYLLADGLPIDEAGQIPVVIPADIEIPVGLIDMESRGDIRLVRIDAQILAEIRKRF